MADPEKVWLQVLIGDGGNERVSLSPCKNNMVALAGFLSLKEECM